METAKRGGLFTVCEACFHVVFQSYSLISARGRLLHRHQVAELNNRSLILNTSSAFRCYCSLAEYPLAFHEPLYSQDWCPGSTPVLP